MTLLETPTTPVSGPEPRDPVPMAAAAVAPGAADLVAEVLAGGRLATGPKVESFEAAVAAMAGTDHAVAVTNGTASLELLLEALGIGPGDEVIAPAFTFAATVSAIVRRGATARLVDITGDFTLDPDAVRAAIGPRTAAILPVHLFGQPADLPALAALGERHGLALVEDAAQAHGATVADRPVGSWGHGSFSFYATKNVSCGEGGAVTTDDDAVARRIRLLRNQGMEERHHHVIAGTNLRMSELHAALGLASMARLDSTTARRRRNASGLTRDLDGAAELLLPRPVPAVGHAWHQYTVLAAERGLLARALADADVGFGIHYPMPVQDQPGFADRPDVVADDTPVARHVAARCLSLPVHHDLTSEHRRRTVEAVLTALEHGPWR